jgi:hypothetical protein
MGFVSGYDLMVQIVIGLTNGLFTHDSPYSLPGQNATAGVSEKAPWRCVPPGIHENGGSTGDKKWNTYAWAAPA